MLKPPSSDHNSPHDSLSPLSDGESSEFKAGLNNGRRFSFEGSADEEEVVFCTEDAEQGSHFTFPKSANRHEAATEISSTTACSPRSTLIIRNHKPCDLSLVKTNGLTTIPLAELKHRIGDARTDTNATRVQVPRPKANHLPKTPDTPSPLIVMGNMPSTIAGSAVPDSASARSAVKKPNRSLRKSSTNLLKRIDSQPPLPPKLTGAVIHVQQQASPISTHGIDDENDEDTAEECMDLNHPSDESQDMICPHPAPPETITNRNALQLLNTSTMHRESSSDSNYELRRENRSPQKHNKRDKELQPPERQSALSPSIPAPSPLPEDSPHKYGLKDRTDTPNMPEPEEINVVKARRRSSGLDIFNEAKSLQSASSFLNGLSTSRRRAESAHPGTDPNAWTVTSQETTRPYSTRPQSRPTSTLQTTYSSERCRGHNFKPSGFAYSRPLTMAQIKCYRNHARLIPNRNKKASVECAVCHIDDDNDHFSCSWCAIRMCRFCRRDFAERGMSALKERIKQAELGNPSPSSSSESLGGVSRTRKSYQ